jgi:signal transduction histidine kinase
MFDDFLTREVDGRASGDTGIGLGLARSVVHLYEGSITVRNRPEGGAEFIVRLPLANESGDPAQSDTGQDNWSGA